MGTKLIMVAALAVGWLAGLVAQRAVVETTGYMDVHPGLMLLGMTLCLVAGGAVRILAPERRPRAGVIGGVAMMASIVVGYAVLAFAYGDRFAGRESGETPLSLLLESWFWIGVPLVVSAGLGLAGWLAADRLGGGHGTQLTAR